LNFIGDLGVEFLDQENHICDLGVKPFDTAWKFYPPRLSPEDHEVFLDNDLVIYSGFPEFNDFRSRSDSAIVSSAHRAFFGNFKPKIETPINTGFFGIPPGFDFASKIDSIAESISQWSDHCDDQGAFCIAVEDLRLITIPLNTIWVCNPNVDFAVYGRGSSGTHFAGSNQGDSSYLYSFLKQSIKI
jgi:hypothetical protein